MFMVAIDDGKCVGCGECTKGCPAQILDMGKEGKAEVSGDPSECMGCQACVMVCPCEAINVSEF